MPHSVFKPKRRDPKSGKQKVGRYWHGQYRLDGEARYTRVSLSTTDKRVAEKRLAELVEPGGTAEGGDHRTAGPGGGREDAAGRAFVCVRRVPERCGPVEGVHAEDPPAGE